MNKVDTHLHASLHLSQGTIDFYRRQCQELRVFNQNRNERRFLVVLWLRNLPLNQFCILGRSDSGKVGRSFVYFCVLDSISLLMFSFSTMICSYAFASFCQLNTATLIHSDPSWDHWEGLRTWLLLLCLEDWHFRFDGAWSCMSRWTVHHGAGEDWCGKWVVQRNGCSHFRGGLPSLM